MGDGQGKVRTVSTIFFGVGNISANFVENRKYLLNIFCLYSPCFWQADFIFSQVFQLFVAQCTWLVEIIKIIKDRNALLYWQTDFAPTYSSTVARWLQCCSKHKKILTVNTIKHWVPLEAVSHVTDTLYCYIFFIVVSTYMEDGFSQHILHIICKYPSTVSASWWIGLI